MPKGVVGGSFGSVAGFGGIVGSVTIIPPSGPPSFTDTFARADAPTLGPPWVEFAQSGSAQMGVLSGEARSAAAAGSDIVVGAYVDLGMRIQRVEWDMSNWPKGPVFSFFRFINLSNCWFVSGTGSNPTTMHLFRRTGGVESLRATVNGVSWGAGHRLIVEDTGSTITVKINNTAIPGLTTNDNAHGNATMAGIGGNSRSSGGGGGPYLQPARWTRFHVSA
ncbi:hypothetical protein E6P97_02795 [Patescibacteria group bacterium]|nr:MAG: hypothetical protein E6P97_02795 [Patescibacteria group bacterium]